MSAHSPSECLGTLFPDMLTLASGRPVSARVFGYQICHPGGLGPPVKQLTYDVAAWQDCQGCPSFRNCYEFSMAKLAMETSLGCR